MPNAPCLGLIRRLVNWQTIDMEFQPLLPQHTGWEYQGDQYLGHFGQEQTLNLVEQSFLVVEDDPI